MQVATRTHHTSIRTIAVHHSKSAQEMQANLIANSNSNSTFITDKMALAVYY